MKKLISIILAITVLFSFSACADSELEMPKKTLDEYPTLSSSEGYTVSGKVSDNDGNGLMGASITINDKVMAITDSKGYYSVTALTGAVKVAVDFFDYEFARKEYEVSSFSDELNFSGSSQFKAEATTKMTNGATLYGVSYAFNSLSRSADITGVAYNLNNTGKTTITPYKEGFDFYPKSIDVYSGNAGVPVEFVAVPKEDTYTISGQVSFIGSSDLPSVPVFVNGMRYTNTVLSTSNGITKMVYKIEGLPRNSEKEVLVTCGEGRVGFVGSNAYVVSGEKTGANFDMLPCKEIDVELNFSGDDKPTETFQYYVKVVDKDGQQIYYENFTNRGTAYGVLVAEGSKIIVESRDGKFSAERETVTASFMNNIRAKSISIQSYWLA